MTYKMGDPFLGLSTSSLLKRSSGCSLLLGSEEGNTSSENRSAIFCVLFIIEIASHIKKGVCRTRYTLVILQQFLRNVISLINMYFRSKIFLRIQVKLVVL